ncbi:MAG: ATP-binding protein [Candidatus Methanomethylicota archaeon]|nr:MAG: ATP-binding protein [Candidatus Verstraetearchaeota archaeon]
MKNPIEELKNKIEDNMKRIDHKIVIVSGKGGVGKSSITALLALAAAIKNKRSGILDADIHGPSIPKILGLEGESLRVESNRILPVKGPLNVEVVSIQFLLPTEDSPVIWRGPLKGKLIGEFLANVQWNNLNYLFVDLPPGTGDEALSIAQFMRTVDGAVIVTIPSDLSRIVVKKAVNFCRKLNLPIIGIVENMSGFTCPNCGAFYRIFGEGAGRRIAAEMNIPLLGEIPIDPRLNECNDEGEPYLLKHPDTKTSKALMEMAEKLMEKVEGKN